jgi:uncharacterized membrane protein YfcA
MPGKADCRRQRQAFVLAYPARRRESAVVDWTVYWFMFPVCVVIASMAMFSGISGAAMLMPTFLIGFPLIGAPPLSTVEAIGMSLFLETSGFGTGVYRYTKRGLIDTATAKKLVVIALPLGAVGALAAQYAPDQTLKVLYGLAMLGLAGLLVVEARSCHGESIGGDSEADATGANASSGGAPAAVAEDRTIVAADGATYRYQARGLSLQQAFSGVGAFVAGLISTGVGEATLPTLVRRSRLPVPVAAATSTMVVAATVVGAALTHLIQLAAEGGLTAIPWNLIVWAVPGAVVGAVIGTRLQGRVNETAARWFFSALFAAIGVAFLLAFTVFAGQFAGG